MRSLLISGLVCMVIVYMAGAHCVAAGSDRATRRIGGGCSYEEYPGKAVITRIKKTQQSMKQSKTIGGPGYEGYEVWFRFKTDTFVKRSAALRAIRREHSFRLTNSWYVGEKYLKKYGLKEGREYTCLLKVKTGGGCTPILFRCNELDQTDYFESRKP